MEPQAECDRVLTREVWADVCKLRKRAQEASNSPSSLWLTCSFSSSDGGPVKVMRRQRFRLTGKIAVPSSSGGWELGWFRANAHRKLRLGEDGCLLGGNQVEFRVLYQ